MGKNNQQLMNSKLANQKQRFALRKLTVGVASVLLGTTLTMIGGVQSASANGTSPAGQQNTEQANSSPLQMQMQLYSISTHSQPAAEQGQTAVYFKTANSDQQVDYQVISGVVGSTKTVQAPAHYQLANPDDNTVTIQAMPATINGRPNTLQIPESKTIYVTPIQSTYTSIIRYVDSDNHSVGIFTPNVTVDLNGEFITNADDINKVINDNVPTGYHFDYGHVDGTNPFNFGNITVHVLTGAPAQTTPSTNGETAVYFMNGDNQVTLQVLTGTVGDSQKISAPAGYKFVSGHKHESVEIQAKTGFMPQSVTFAVTPTTGTFHSIIRYIKPDGTNASFYTPNVDVAYDGEYITNVDAVNDVIKNNVPDGYTITNGLVNGTTPYNFGDILVNVKSGETTRPTTTEGAITVLFMDNGKQVSLENLSGKIGDKVAFTVPAGYELVSGQPSTVEIQPQTGYAPQEVKIAVQIPSTTPSTTPTTPTNPSTTPSTHPTTTSKPTNPSNTPSTHPTTPSKPTNPSTTPSTHTTKPSDHQNQSQPSDHQAPTTKPTDHKTTPAGQQGQTPVNEGKQTPTQPVDHNSSNSLNGNGQLGQAAANSHQNAADQQIATEANNSGQRTNKENVAFSGAVLAAAKNNTANNDQLPQTGNNGSEALGLGVASLIAMLGLAGYKKSRN